MVTLLLLSLMSVDPTVPKASVYLPPGSTCVVAPTKEDPEPVNLLLPDEWFLTPRANAEDCVLCRRSLSDTEADLGACESRLCDTVAPPPVETSTSDWLLPTVVVGGISLAVGVSVGLLIALSVQ
jgi:hypothetical protein